MSRSARLTGILAIGSAGAGSLVVPTQAASGPTVEVIVGGVARQVSVGDVVVHGTRSSTSLTACEIPGLVVGTVIGAIPPNGITAGVEAEVLDVALEVDASCDVLVSAITTANVFPLLDSGGNVQSVEAANTDAPSVDEVSPLDTTLACTLPDPLGLLAPACGHGSTKYVGETKATVLEQFGITAYETDDKFYYSQSNYDGTITGRLIHGYCYHSGFPGNHFNNCRAWSPQWSGTYGEGDVSGHYWNDYLSVDMTVAAQFTPTETNWGGRCSMPTGSLPPLWSLNCAISLTKTK